MKQRCKILSPNGTVCRHRLCPLSVPTALLLIGFLLISLGYIWLTGEWGRTSLLVALIVGSGVILIGCGIVLFIASLWNVVKRE